MNSHYHLLSDGELTRSENTLRFQAVDGEDSRIPVESVDALFCYGQTTFNTRLLSFLNEQHITLHVFGWTDQYQGTFLPDRAVRSGECVVAQVDHYLHPARRRTIASAFVRGSIDGMRQNLQYYQRQGLDLSDALAVLDETVAGAHEPSGIDALRGTEGTARKAYYSAFDAIIDGFSFDRREYNPPSSEVNALVSFTNALVYSACTTALRQTALDPTVGYLHAPGNRRASLALDIADIFKPLLADRLTFRLCNRGQLTPDSFRDEVDGYLLTDESRKAVLAAFEETMEQTVQHPSLNRSVSYKYLLRLEAYKLKKHLVCGEDYEPFKRWW
jgi:CRISPR-associated protein Cas1